MLKNLWYVAGESTRVTKHRTRKVRLLGQGLILFRSAEGTPVALPDECTNDPHVALRRAFAELSDGFEDPRPLRARVDGYPTQEHYGLVWVFLGDLAPRARPVLPRFPEYGDPHFRCIRGQHTFEAPSSASPSNALYIPTQISSRFGQAVFIASSPIDAHTACMHWILARNFFLHPVFDAVAHRRMDEVLRRVTTDRTCVRDNAAEHLRHDDFVTTFRMAVGTAWGQALRSSVVGKHA